MTDLNLMKTCIYVSKGTRKVSSTFQIGCQHRFLGNISTLFQVINLIAKKFVIFLKSSIENFI